MFSFIFGGQTPEQWEKQVQECSEKLNTMLGEPEPGQEQDLNFCRRFVVANECDLEQAAAHVKQERDWRKEKLPISLSEKEEEVISSGRVRFLGVNADGIAVVVYDFMEGEFLEGFTEQEIVNAQIHTSEEALKVMKAEKPDGPGKWIIVSIGGAPPRSWTREAGPIFERYYAERLSKSIVYPVPHFLKRLVDAIIYWLPARTKAKFCIVSTEEEFRELANLPVDGPIKLPEDMLGGIEGKRARAAAAGRKESEEGKPLDMSTMDAETRQVVEEQAKTDPELAAILSGAKQDELYRLQMQA